MGQIEDLRVFVAAVDNGGIAKAGEMLGVAKSAVSRRLSRLEERYGVRLIDRDPRVFEVTSAGRELYQRALRMVADADDLDADFMHGQHSLSGPLSISVPREFGLACLKPILFDFAAKHGDIDMTIDFDDRTVDLERENYDLAIRIATESPPGLIAERLGTVRHMLVTSKSYADRYSLPKSPEELTAHPLLHYGPARRAVWAFEWQGKARSIEFQPALNSNSGPFLVHAVKRGMGIVRLPDFVVRESEAKNDLVPVLSALHFNELGIFIVHNASRRLNRRMRALVTALKANCAALC